MTNKATNSFAVAIPNRDTDPNLFYKKELLELIAKNYPHFTVAGKNPPVVRRGVEYAGHNNLLTFGTAKTHTVEWVERTTYACEKGYAPVYDLVKDWNKIIDKLKALDTELFPRKYRISNGMEVEFFKNYVKVGYNRVNYADYYRLNSFAAIILTKEDIEALYYSVCR